jgi:hypothetical protein
MSSQDTVEARLMPATKAITFTSRLYKLYLGIIASSRSPDCMCSSTGLDSSRHGAIAPGWRGSTAMAPDPFSLERQAFQYSTVERDMDVSKWLSMLEKAFIVILRDIKDEVVGLNVFNTTNPRSRALENTL